MSGLELEEGRVYIRDQRNGNIHPYEDLLAQMPYMKTFVAGTEEEKAVENDTSHITLSGLARAAEWDRLAQMTPEQRLKELDGKPAPWERPDYLNAADQVAAPEDAAKARKTPTAVAPAPAAPAVEPAPQTPPAATEAAPEAAPEAPKVAYRLSAKANGFTYQQLLDTGWTKDTLIAEGYLVEAAPNGG